MSATLGIDKNVDLPKFTGETFMKRAEKSAKNGELEPNKEGTAQDRKALIYATCSVNYNNPGVGEAALKVLTHLGVSVKTDYPGCCGMPYLEQGNLEKVAQNAASVSAALRSFIDEGYDILTLTASCGLMFKFEWPLIVPDNEDVRALSAATRDISEYIVQIADKNGLPDGLQKIEGDVQVHLACHSRAQNMGPKSADLLRLIPDADIGVIERCSGHGGTFGVMKDTHQLAVKVGKPVARNVAKSEAKTVVSDCPLAAKHIVQGVEYLDSSAKLPEAAHPIEVFARAYGLI